MSRDRATILVTSYMASGGGPVEVEVSGVRVGDLVVHRPYRAWLREPTAGKGWTVSHMGLRVSVRGAFPSWFYDRGAVTAKRATLAAWARWWQDQIPEFFDLIRSGTFSHETPGHTDLAQRAQRVGASYAPEGQA